MTKKIIYRAIERVNHSHKFMHKFSSIEQNIKILFNGKVPFAIFHEIGKRNVKKAVSMLSLEQQAELRRLMN